MLIFVSDEFPMVHFFLSEKSFCFSVSLPLMLYSVIVTALMMYFFSSNSLLVLVSLKVMFVNIMVELDARDEDDELHFDAATDNDSDDGDDDHRIVPGDTSVRIYAAKIMERYFFLTCPFVAIPIVVSSVSVVAFVSEDGEKNDAIIIFWSSIASSWCTSLSSSSAGVATVGGVSMDAP